MEVKVQRRLKGCQHELVAAERTKQRVTPQCTDALRGSRDHARLRPAQQLVAAEGHQVGPGLEHIARHRLVLDSGGRLGWPQSAASQVFNERHAVPAGKVGKAACGW